MNSIWEEYGVNIDEKYDMYCLDDIVVNILMSQNKDRYIKKILNSKKLLCTDVTMLQNGMQWS